MVWFEIILLFALLLALHHQFRAYGLLIFAGILVLWGGYVWYRSNAESADADKIELTFRIDAAACPELKPIAVAIANNSPRTVRSIVFDAVVRQRGFSDERGRLASARSDKILKPGENFRACFVMPSLNTPIPPGQIEFALDRKVVLFDE